MGFLGNADGTGVTIGIVDTGIQLNHSQFLNANGVSRVLPGTCLAGFSPTLCSTADNMIGGDDLTWPTVTHGTHVAGIAAGLTTGLANNAWILPVRVCDSSNGSCPGDIDGGIVWASQHGANVVNLSVGGTFLSGTDLNAARTAVANGTLLVVAAGNSGNATPAAGFLAGAALYDGVRGSMLVVGAVDNNGNIASWSQTPGTTCMVQSGQNYCMQNYFVVAPGVGIVSSVGGGGYGTLSGTSMATPYVTGVAADIKSMWPYLSMAQVASVILGTTIDRGAPGPDPVYGMGEVNLAKALLPAGTTALVTGGTNVLTTKNVITNATNATIGGVMSVGIAGSAMLKSVVVVDKFGRDYTADLTKGVRNEGFDISSFVQLDQLLAMSSAPGTVESGLKAVSSQGYSDALGLISMSGYVKTVTTPAAFATEPTTRDQMRTYMTNVAVSASPFQDVSFDMGYKLRMSGRLNQYDVGASPAYDGLFVSASAVNSPYAALTDGGNYAGATVSLADGLDVRTGYSWMNAGQQQSLFATSAGFAPYLVSNQTGAFQQRAADAAVVSMSWRFADWGGLGLTASQTDERNGILGGSGTGALNLARSANTSAIDATMRVGLGSGWIATLAYGEGTTSLNAQQNGLLGNVSGLHSRSYGVALATRNLFADDDTFGFALTRPMYIDSGSGMLTAATGADVNGNLTIGHEQVSFAESAPETDLEVGYTKNFLNGRLSLQSDAAYQMDVGGQTGRNAATFITRLRFGL
ncbi:MAG TPA: S8 family peptidase [Rhizomicrobium sp.]|nr:S8 family peptidase [Rhizomicrobium sp.]